VCVSFFLYRTSFFLTFFQFHFISFFIRIHIEHFSSLEQQQSSGAEQSKQAPRFLEYKQRTKNQIYYTRSTKLPCFEHLKKSSSAKRRTKPNSKMEATTTTVEGLDGKDVSLSASTDQIDAPLVFQCKKCNVIVSDSFAFQVADEDLRVVIVHTACNVSFQANSLITSKKV